MKRCCRRHALAICSLFALAGTAAAQCSDLRWSTQFGWSGVNPEGEVHCLAIYDDGNGPKLYAGGQFLLIDGSWTTFGLAVWNSDHWAPVGDGRLWAASNEGNPAQIYSMTTWDPDGSGPERSKLVMVGDLFNSGPNAVDPAHTIATWDGTTFATLGNGIPFGDAEVWGTGRPSGNAVAVYNGELYVAGAVSLTGFRPNESGVMKWTGTDWVAVGHAKFKGGWPAAMAVYDDGTGEKLYVGGVFDQVWIWDPVARQHTTLPSTASLVTWDGTAWQGKTAVVPIVNGVNNLHVLDIDGPGPEPESLFIGDSNFASTGGTTWRLTGTTATLIPGLDAQAPAVFDAGDGPALYAMGPDFKLMRWTGTGAATVVSNGTVQTPNGSRPCCDPRGGYAKAAMSFDLGDGPRLLVGGYLSGVSEPVSFEKLVSSYGLLTWDGASFAPMHSNHTPVVFSADSSLAETMGLITGGVVFDEDGPGPLRPALYATGQFSAIAGKDALSFAKWDGDVWTPVGVGLTSSPDDGLARPPIMIDPTVVGSSIGSIMISPSFGTSSGVFQYATGAWSQLGPAFAAKDLAAFDDGSGEALYAVGQFPTIGTENANNIARWDGSAWTEVGMGLRFTPNPAIASANLAISHNDGSGNRLYVFGKFDQAGSVATPNIASWNGTAWSAVGAMPGVANAQFKAAVSITTGSAAGLYVQRTPAVAGVTIFRWNGATWLPIAGPAGAAVTLVGTDDPNGGVLYAADAISYVTNNLWTFDGTSWTQVAAPALFGAPTSMTSFADTRGQGLYFFGSDILAVDAQNRADDGPFGLSVIDAISSVGIARLGCAPTPCAACAADYDSNGGVDGGDLSAFFADFEVGEACADVDGNGGVDGGDLAFFFAVFEAGGC